MALTTIPASLSATALTLTTAAQPNVTSLGTLTTLTVDDITINGSTISDAGDLTFDVGGDIILDADGDNWLFKKSGTTLLNIQKDSNNVEFISSISDGDMKFRGNDGGSTITAMTIDMSAGGNVGIGIAPSSALSIYRPANVAAYIEVAGNNNTPGGTSMLFGQDSASYGYCWNRANQAVLFGTNGTERMRIDANGNFAINRNAGALGTATNRTAFTINGTNETSFNIATGGTQRAYLFSNGSYAQLSTVGSIPLNLGVNDSSKMTIDTSGNVSVSPGTFTASNVINIATESTTQTTTARQWATIKNTGTGAGDYSEMAIRNNADDYIIFGSIGSNYSNANWSNSSYLYANRELRIKSNNALRFFSGGMNLNTHDNMVLESSGHLTLKGQIVGGFGAIGTGGTTDWNHATNARSGMGYTLLLGNATNGPGVSSIYYHPVTFEYSSKNGNGNMTQLAIPYYGSATIYIRQRYGGSWSSWGAV